MRTENLRPVSVGDHGRVTSSVVIGAMLVASAVAYVLLALQPGLVKSISSVWGSTVASGTGPAWAVPAMAAGIAIAAASLSMLVLSAFVRGVQRAPYLWLSPVLVGFSTLVLARLRIELPFYGVPLAASSRCSPGLLLLGGGALVQIRGVACTLSGLLMLLLPSADVRRRPCRAYRQRRRGVVQLEHRVRPVPVRARADLDRRRHRRMGHAPHARQRNDACA